MPIITDTQKSAFVIKLYYLGRPQRLWEVVLIHCIFGHHHYPRLQNRRGKKERTETTEFLVWDEMTEALYHLLNTFSMVCLTDSGIIYLYMD